MTYRTKSAVEQSGCIGDPGALMVVCPGGACAWAHLGLAGGLMWRVDADVDVCLFGEGVAGTPGREMWRGFRDLRARQDRFVSRCEFHVYCMYPVLPTEYTLEKLKMS